MLSIAGPQVSVEGFGHLEQFGDAFDLLALGDGDDVAIAGFECWCRQLVLEGHQPGPQRGREHGVDVSGIIAFDDPALVELLIADVDVFQFNPPSKPWRSSVMCP